MARGGKSGATRDHDLARLERAWTRLGIRLEALPGRGDQRQLDVEGRPAALRLPDLDLPSVGRDHGAHDRKPETCPAAVPAAARVGAVERLEYAVAVRGGQAGPVVGDRELRRPVLGRDLDLHGRGRGCVDERVADEVADDLAQARVVAGDQDM